MMMINLVSSPLALTMSVGIKHVFIVDSFVINFIGPQQEAGTSSKLVFIY